MIFFVLKLFGNSFEIDIKWYIRIQILNMAIFYVGAAVIFQ